MRLEGERFCLLLQLPRVFVKTITHVRSFFRVNFHKAHILATLWNNYSHIATSYDSVWYAIIEWPLFDAPSSTHGVFTSLVNLTAVACISVEISLGSCLCRDILKVKDQGFITNCNFLWLCVICNHQVVTTRCAIKYPRCFYFFYLSMCCYLHFWRKKFGSMLAQGYFKGQKSSINQKL